MFFGGKAQQVAEEFKRLLNDLIIDSGLKQDTIAFQGGVKQQTISQWIDPDGDRHLPAFQLLLLDEAIVMPLAWKFIERFNKKIVDDSVVSKRNGSILDEVLEIGKIEGRLAEMIEDQDKKKIREYAEALEQIAGRLRDESK